MSSTTTTTTTSLPDTPREQQQQHRGAHNGLAAISAGDEQHFFNAVLAAGGTISRTPQAASNKMSATTLLSPSNHTNEADISVNEDMFLPSIAAAAAVTLSPSFGPSSLPSDFSFPTNDDFAGSWQRGKDASLPPLESESDYQLRMAMMNGLSLSSGSSGSSSSSATAATSTLPKPSQVPSHLLQQPQQQQQQSMRYDANYAYYDPTPAYGSGGGGGAFPLSASVHLPPPPPQMYQQQAAAAAPFRYDQSTFVSSQQQQQVRMDQQRFQMAQQQQLSSPQHMMYYAQQMQHQQQQQQHGSFLDYQQQQNPYSSRLAAMPRQQARGGGGGSHSMARSHHHQHQQHHPQQQQHVPNWASYDDVYLAPPQHQQQPALPPQQQQQQHAIPVQPARSTLVEELRAAIRASNSMANGAAPPAPLPASGRQGPLSQQQHRNNRPGYMAPHHHQQQQQQMNNAMLLANQAPLVNIPFTLADIRGHAVELAQDQYGSRWLQQQLCSSTVSAADKQRLFAELLPASLSLASDTFGNYCVQILLNPAVGTPEQQRQLCTRAFEGNIVELSRNTYACRCIQSLIKLFQLGDSVIPIYMQDKMMRELEPEILVLVTDSNANHVCQQVIERIRPIQRIEFILNAFKGNYVQLAKDPFGCRVCQRVLEHASEEFVEPALEELLEQMDNLVTDSMGNYVVQHIITAYSGDRYIKQRTRLVNCVKSKLLQFATHKFASNVVEKVLEYGDSATRREIIQMMLETPPGGGVSMLQIMMSDLFANYVCQRSLAVADRDQLVRLVQVVRQNANELRRMTYGKHILAACDKAAIAAGIQ